VDMWHRQRGRIVISGYSGNAPEIHRKLKAMASRLVEDGL
jgi:hypothetical protein